jgi:hypothetical protein
MNLENELARCDQEIARCKWDADTNDYPGCALLGLADWWTERKLILKEMGLVEIFWTEKLKLPNKDAFKEFIQKMANRLAQGHARYGPPERRRMYMTRLELEVKAYRKTGNSEHLYNIANYAHLEAYVPENMKFHHDSSADSATRREVGI